MSDPFLDSESEDYSCAEEYKGMIELLKKQNDAMDWRPIPNPPAQDGAAHE